MLAWRNLWRNHRRTIIMLGAITIGAWAMIFMSALMRGMVNDMIREGIRSLPGHVQIHNPKYRDDPSIANLIPDTDEEIAARFDGAGISDWISRVRVPAVVSSEQDARGVTFIGIDPARERTMSFVADDIVEGRFLDDIVTDVDNDIGVVDRAVNVVVGGQRRITDELGPSFIHHTLTHLRRTERDAEFVHHGGQHPAG